MTPSGNFEKPLKSISPGQDSRLGRPRDLKVYRRSESSVADFLRMMSFPRGQHYMSRVTVNQRALAAMTLLDNCLSGYDSAARLDKRGQGLPSFGPPPPTPPKLPQRAVFETGTRRKA